MVLIQLLFLTALPCASPLGIIYGEWSTQGRHTAFGGPSALKDAVPFAVEEKSRTKPISATVRADVGVRDPLPQPATECFLSVPRQLPTLTGFQLRVSERPPPYCL